MTLGFALVALAVVQPTRARAGAVATTPMRAPGAGFHTEEAPGWNLIRPLTFLAVGGVLAAVSWDEAHPDGMSRGIEQASPIEPLIDVGNTYGSGWVVGGGSAAVLAMGAVSGAEGLQAFGSDLCRSFVYTSLVTTAIKYGVDRKRPSGGGLSFPSGHTAVAFSTVPVIAHHLGWQAGLATGLLATHTGLARMEDRKHFLSDVLMGAAIGLAVGDLVTQHRSRTDWSAGLVVAPGFAGYTMRF